jgi:hypothetical protein
MAGRSASIHTRRAARFGVAAVAVGITCAFTPRSALAQAERFSPAALTPSTARSSADPKSAAPPFGAAAAGVTLENLLDQVWWDPARQGALLIVSPETTWNSAETATGDDSRILPRRVQPLPPPERDGLYRLGKIADAFQRRLTPLGSVTAFAPRVMTILNTERLPPPDPYAGMSASDKLRLLRASLSPEQWRLLGGDTGLGAADLDAAQRPLFLSLLPMPFEVTPIADGGSEGRGPIRLTEAARASVRLRLYRALDWVFVNAEGATTAIYLDQPGINGATYRVAAGMSLPRNKDELFGVRVREEAPSRLKPGDLAFDHPALAVSVPLEGGTVGDLVRAIGRQTRLELYCDPRHAGRTVWTRGASARAGDLLKALCWALGGAIRRVGPPGEARPAFVLTDDRVGLGTRHARLETWAWASAVARQVVEARTAARLEATDWEAAVSWAEGDPVRPSADIAARIEAFRQKLRDGREPLFPTANDPDAGQLFVPVADLSSAAQDVVRGQIASSHGALSVNPEITRSAPRTDRVRIDLRIRAAFLVPGIGRVMGADSDLFGGQGEDAIERARSRNFTSGPPKTPPDPLRLAPALPTRALLVVAGTEEEMTRMARAARRRGFNALWVEVPDGNPQTLTAATAAGKLAGIAVSVVVRLLRPVPQMEGPDGKDLTMLGAPSVQFAGAEADRTTQAGGVRGASGDNRGRYARALERVQRRGDWLRCDDPGVAADVIRRVRAVAKVPGLAGIVFRDGAAPGYRGDVERRATTGTSRDLPGAYDMGYTEAMRLAFLRSDGGGIDPVDLSPLPDGRITLPRPDGQAPPSRIPLPDLLLPQFPDYGVRDGTRIINGRSTLELGAKDAADRWRQFREKVADTFIQAVARSVREEKPELAIWNRFGLDEHIVSVDWFGSVDAEKARGVAVPPQPFNHSASWARLRSKSVLKTFQYGPIGGAGDTVSRFAWQVQGTIANAVKGWDGIVVDLSEQPANTALQMLAAFAEVEDAETAAAVAGAVGAKKQTPQTK